MYLTQPPVGYTRVWFALVMYISSCLCHFCLRWVHNANVLFGGVWALKVSYGIPLSPLM